MKNTSKTKAQLLEELSGLHSHVAELEKRYEKGNGKKVIPAVARVNRTGLVDKKKATAGPVRGKKYPPSGTSKVQEAIEDTEAKFRVALEGETVSMATLNPDLQLVQVNRAFCDLLGYTKQALKRRTIKDITHPDDVEQSVDLTTRVFKSGLPNFQFENRFLTKSQTIIWCNVAASVVRDREGKPTLIVATMENITERKQAEMALKRANQQLEILKDDLIRRNESFVQALGEIVYDYDVSADRIGWNGVYVKLLGYNVEEMGTNRASWLSRIHPEDYQRVMEEFAQAQTERRLFDVEYRFQRQNGNYIWMHDRGVLHFNEEGSLQQVSGVLLDINRQKQAELKLRTRASQQAGVATLGTEALGGALVSGLMKESAILIAGLLEAEYSQVLEYIPESHMFLLQAGIGWREGLVGSAKIDAESRFYPGYTLGSHEPVIVEDFHTEKRFQIEPLLDDQDIRSGIWVTIPGPGQPLGVLGVCTRKLQSFHQEDIHFLQGIANVLGEYIARHNVEIELLEEEARLQAIIEESPAAIYVKDLRGRYILSNKKHKTYCNIETEEIAGKTDYDLFPPEVAEAHQENDQKVLRAGMPLVSEEVIPHEEGVHTFISNKFPLRNHHGTPYAICGISTDITERKRSEIALGETQREYEQLVNSVKGIVWEADLRTFQFTLVSQEAERLLGYPCTRWIEEPTFWQDHIHPEDRDWAIEYCIQHSAQNDYYEFEYRMIAANGDVVWLRDLVTVVWDKGERRKLQGVMVDTTEQKLAQKAIRESEMKLQQITDAVPGAVYQYKLTEDGVQSFQFISGGVEELFELTQAEAQEDFSRVWDRILPADQPILWDSIQVSGKTMRPWSYDFRIRTATGKVKWLRGSSIPDQQKEDNSIVWNGMLSDITELKQAESMLAGQKSILEQIALGIPLSDILNSLCQIVEAQSAGMVCSILLLEGDKLRHGAAPSLPDAYNQAIDGITIGPAVGSCGTAACRKEQVVVSDIATDPLWEPYKDLALTHGLRACWSTPIRSSEGFVLGTFAMYYTQPRYPNPKEQELVRVSTYLAGIAIERRRSEEALQAGAHQQALVAELGQSALTGIDLPTLMHNAVSLIAQTLEVEYCKVLELLPDGKEMILRAVFGCPADAVNHITVGAGLDSQAGYTLVSDEPVVVEDLRTETRFSGPPLLHQLGVISGMSVIISGKPHHYGVLEVHSTQLRTFTSDDVHFVQGVANVLALAIERKRIEEALWISEQAIRELYEITSAPEISFESRVHTLLELGCKRFNLPIGVVARREGDHCKMMFIRTGEMVEDFVSEGSRIAMCELYCSAALEAEEPICFGHASTSDWAAHRGCATTGLEAYLGTKIVVGGEKYGTLCFAGPEPYRGTFTEGAKDFPTTDCALDGRGD